MFCFGRLIALTRPEIIVARLYSGHLLNDVVCGLIDMLRIRYPNGIIEKGTGMVRAFRKIRKNLDLIIFAGWKLCVATRSSYL